MTELPQGRKKDTKVTAERKKNKGDDAMPMEKDEDQSDTGNIHWAANQYRVDQACNVSSCNWDATDCTNGSKVHWC